MNRRSLVVDNIHNVIARNIQELRTEMKITQSKLAEALNYSDKAISKWERGESLPDVTVLKRIADYFGVTVDYLLEGRHDEEELRRSRELPKGLRRNRFIIATLATMLVWFVATFVFVVYLMLPTSSGFPMWVVFIYAIPLSCIVMLVFNCIWGDKRFNFLIISVMQWSLILCAHLTIHLTTSLNLWYVYILGIPAQIMIILWSGLRKKI